MRPVILTQHNFQSKPVLSSWQTWMWKAPVFIRLFKHRVLNERYCSIRLAISNCFQVSGNTCSNIRIHGKSANDSGKLIMWWCYSDLPTAQANFSACPNGNSESHHHIIEIHVHYWVISCMYVCKKNMRNFYG